VTLLETAGMHLTFTGQVTKPYLRGFGMLRITSRGPALWRSLLVRHGIFGRPEMTSFFKTYQSLWDVGKWVFRAIFGYINTESNKQLFSPFLGGY
jgi:hypothetical protein